MDKIKLVLPNFAMKEKAVDFRQEFFDIGEMVINGSYKLDMVEKYTYEEWVDIIHTNLDKEKVILSLVQVRLTLQLMMTMRLLV